MQYSAELEVGGRILRGMVHQPDVVGRMPVVILYHGFTGSKLEQHRLLLKTSRALESAGIASIRFDFGGHGESDGDFEQMTLTREVEEAQAILDFAWELDFVDTSRIGLLGFSLGGAIASIIAGQTSETVKALALWAPAGMVDELLSGMRKMCPQDSSGRSLFWGNRLNPEAFIDFERWDVYEIARHYSGPVMIAHGTDDQSVPLEASERYLGIYGDRAKLTLLEGGNHTFDDSDLEEKLIGISTEFFAGTL